MKRVPALTLWRPWTTCFTDIPEPAAKRIENRSWVTTYRGDVYLHGGKAWDDEALYLAEKIWKNTDPYYYVGDVRVCLATDEPILSGNPADHPGGVVAVAELIGICTASLNSNILRCDCGPWAFAGQAHWRFDKVRKVPEAVPCRGAQQLWALPADVEAAIQAQLAAVAS
ncbi:hypothetical protein [Dactylosporangium salmoneum]|uniref:ASCH domain-containing protein n=1 Tax=Dactylosporangium salmoneum TaxID=53361 RepID=A0ABN3G8T5_9ACTN